MNYICQGGVHAQFLATHARTLQFPGKISAHARNTHANSHTHLSTHATRTNSCGPEDSKKVRHAAVASKLKELEQF